jgi:hypothetical protein
MMPNVVGAKCNVGILGCAEYNRLTLWDFCGAQYVWCFQRLVHPRELRAVSPSGAVCS